MELEENINKEPTIEQGIEGHTRPFLIINGFSNEAIAVDRSEDGTAMKQECKAIEVSKSIIKRHTTHDPSLEDTDIPNEHDLVAMNLPSIMAYKEHLGFSKLSTLFKNMKASL